MAKRIVTTVVIAFCAVLVADEGGAQQSTADGSPSVAEQEGSEEGTETEDETETLSPEELKWSIFESEEKKLHMRVPGGKWETMGPDEFAEEKGKGCAGSGQVNENILVIVQNEDQNSGLFVLGSEEEYVFRNDEELKEYVEKRRDNLLESYSEENITVHKDELEQGERNVTYRLSFTAPVQGRGGGGCAGGGQASAEHAATYLLKEYFVRPAGKNSVSLYRIISSTQEENFPKVKNILERVVQSFEFTGNTAANFYVPDAPESVTPDIEPSSGGDDGQWIMTILILTGLVLALWGTSRRKKKGY